MAISEKDKTEFTKARNRIGKNTIDAMHWLVRFTKTPLEELSEGDFKNLALELYVFTIGGWAQDRRAVIQGVSQEIPIANYSPRYAPDMDQARMYQRGVKESLERFLGDGYMNFTFRDFGLYLRPNETRTATVFYPSLNTLSNGFRYHSACLLGEHAHRIGRCIECKSLYVGIRLQQKFCSPRCRSRATTREFRKAQSKNPNDRRFSK